MARLALLPLALAVLAAGCTSGGGGDDYPVGGGGTGGGTSGPRTDAGTGDGGVDGPAALRGRVCLVSDLRRLIDAAPGDCAATGAGGLNVSLGGSATVLTAADGSFSVPAQDGFNLAWRVTGGNLVTSIVPVSASTLLPAIRDAVYNDLKNASGVIVSPGEGSIVARLVRGGAPVAGATAQIIGGESLRTLYDGASATVWSTISTGTFGVAWLPDNVAGFRTMRIAYGTAQQSSLAVPVPIVDQAITFATIALP
jgi:hypothetical protein